MGSAGLGSSAAIVSASSSQGSCTISAPTVTCTLGTLASAASAAVTMVVEPQIEAAKATDLPPLRGFAHNLRRALPAVIAGLTLRWNSGPVEGHVNRIKMLKQQMFGRANLDLLRRRILLTPCRTVTESRNVDQIPSRRPPERISAALAAVS